MAMCLFAAQPYLGSRVLHLQQLQNGGAVVCDGHVTNVVHQHLHRKALTMLAAEPDRVRQCLMPSQDVHKCLGSTSCQVRVGHLNASTNTLSGHTTQRASMQF